MRSEPSFDALPLSLAGAVFAFFLHGFGAIWPISLSVAHYFVCRATAGVPTVGLLAVWASAIVMLAKVQFGADKWTFAALGSMSPLLSPLAGMDKCIFRGFMPRWWIHYNLVTLRMISFGCDLHWRRCGRESAGDGKSAKDSSDYWSLVSKPSDKVRYSLCLLYTSPSPRDS